MAMRRPTEVRVKGACAAVAAGYAECEGGEGGEGCEGAGLVSSVVRNEANRRRRPERSRTDLPVFLAQERGLLRKTKPIPARGVSDGGRKGRFD